MIEVHLTTEQKKVFDDLSTQEFWLSGRGAGKSFLRRYLIDWLEAQEDEERGYWDDRSSYAS